MEQKDASPQSTTKATIYYKKVILSVWWDLWDFKGIVYFFELLPDNTTINTEV